MNANLIATASVEPVEERKSRMAAYTTLETAKKNP